MDKKNQWFHLIAVSVIIFMVIDYTNMLSVSLLHISFGLVVLFVNMLFLGLTNHYSQTQRLIELIILNTTLVSLLIIDSSLLVKSIYGVVLATMSISTQYLGREITMSFNKIITNIALAVGAALSGLNPIVSIIYFVYMIAVFYFDRQRYVLNYLPVFLYVFVCIFIR